MRAAEWFPPQTGPSIDAHIATARPLGDGLVAVFVQVREEGVVSQWEGPSDLSLDEKWRTVIEILDLRARAVLARVEVPQAVVGSVCPSGELAALVKEARERFEHLRLFTIQLVRGGTP